MPCFEILWLLLVSPNSVTAWLSSLCISDIAYWRQNGTKANFRISSSLCLKGVCIKSKCSIWGFLEGHVISKLIFCACLDGCSKTRENIELLHISTKANVTILFKFAYICFFCGRLQKCFNTIWISILISFWCANQDPRGQKYWLNKPKCSDSYSRSKYRCMYIDVYTHNIIYEYHLIFTLVTGFKLVKLVKVWGTPWQ